MRVLSNNIKDIFYGATDGIVTTFAVVMGAVGASLGKEVILILGFASLIADAFSMAASNYLGTRSEKDVAELNEENHVGSVYVPAMFTFFSFMIAGALPLLPFVFTEGGLLTASLTTGIALFVIGGVLGHFVVKKSWLLWGARMLVIGGTAAAIAFFIGRVVGNFIGA